MKTYNVQIEYGRWYTLSAPSAAEAQRIIETVYKQPVIAITQAFNRVAC